MSKVDVPLSNRLLARLHFDAPGLLTPNVRRFYSGTLLGAIGTGLVLPFFVVYFTQIRHFSLFTSEMLLAWESVLGLAITPVYGTLVDKFGPSRILAVSMTVTSFAAVAIGFASTVPIAFAIATLFATGGAGLWGALTVLLSRFVPEERRQDAFGINFMLINLGIAVGGLVGASIVDLHSLRSFQVLYGLCGVLALADAAVVFSLRRFGGRPEVTERHADAVVEGWGVVLRDRRLLRFLGVSVLLMVCGYGSVEAGLSYFVVHIHHLPTLTVGLLFFFNTMTIVFGQIFMLGRIKGKSRSMVVGAVGLFWGVSWLLATSSLALGALAAIATLCVGQVVFALGETMWAPVSPAIVNDLAVEHLRGRYNALNGLVWGVSGTIGPLIAWALLTGGNGVAWTL
ncbi:MAG TPA: MFS transporter, partial [Acidimicrobiales bacterium]